MGFNTRKVIFFIGRLLLAVALIAMGYHMYNHGHSLYNKHLHALRKLALPDSQGSSLVPGIGITYENLNQQIVKGDAALFALSGLLLILNQRKLGAMFMILAISFILLTKDNFMLKSGAPGSKVNQTEQNQRVLDFFKHLSLIGAALLIIDNGGRKYVKSEGSENRKAKQE
eukprot:403332228